MLQRLRPVAYQYRNARKLHGRRAANVRFGFVADEVERAGAPQVVRHMRGRTGSGDRNVKGLIYQDLIALLVAALQEQQRLLANESRKRKEEVLALATDLQAERSARRHDVELLSGQLQALSSRVRALELGCNTTI